MLFVLQSAGLFRISMTIHYATGSSANWIVSTCFVYCRMYLRACFLPLDLYEPFASSPVYSSLI